MKMNEKRVRLMRGGLQVVFVIAWLPILWLFLSATLGKVLFALVGVPWIVQSVVLFFSLLLIFYAFRFLAVLSEKVFGEK